MPKEICLLILLVQYGEKKFVRDPIRLGEYECWH